ncbi:MAG: hypothetical protein OXT67_00875 [Zetaproteobacteria bacterium]|nr:hypothetical protein [Zetaproteobacteria bacterium]
MVSENAHSLQIADPVEFFREQVADALRQESLEVDEQLEFYLVHLLVDFINPGKTFSPLLLGGEILDTPLALVLGKALETEGADKLRIYKTLGDTSLYITGYFNDYFNRKPFGMDYYINLGKQAYAAVCDLSRVYPAQCPHGPNLYQSLATEFSSYVDVIAAIAERLSPCQNTNLLSLYERWLEQGGERLRKKLQQEGVVPLPTPTGTSN